MTDALVRASAGDPLQQSINKVVMQLTGDSPVQTRLQKVMLNSLENKELLEFIRSGYEVNRQLDPKPMLRALSRSTQIIGKVFEDIANNNNLDGKSLSWIARLGQVFWGLVEVAVPNSILNLLLLHWLKVLYVFEFLIIIGGVLLARPEAQQFGWTALGITASVNVITLILRDLMRGKHAVLRVTVFLIFLIFLVLAALGVVELLGVFGMRVGKTQYPPDGLPPIDWLKQSLKALFGGTSWIARHLAVVLSFFGLVVVLVVLNAIGLFDLIKRKLSGA
jgi:hypothetical protein